jgi:hypothetical protein
VIVWVRGCRGRRIFGMNTTAFVHQAEGLITLAGRIHSQFEESALRANLADLPGVHAVEFTEDGIRVRYNPSLSGEQKFYRAVRRAGFVARNFEMLED